MVETLGRRGFFIIKFVKKFHLKGVDCSVKVFLNVYFVLVGFPTVAFITEDLKVCLVVLPPVKAHALTDAELSVVMCVVVDWANDVEFELSGGVANATDLS